MWGIPVAAAAVLIPASWALEDEALRPPGAQLSRVGERTLSFRQSIDVKATFPLVPDLSSPQPGTVTGLAVSAGTRPANGDPLVSIDGRTVFAITGEVPPYRELRKGDSGPDVRALCDFLVARQALDPSKVDDQFGYNVERAVRIFQSDAGEPIDGIFHPPSTIYLPYPEAAVSELKTYVGDLVDIGTPLLAVRPRATSVTFTVAGSEDRPPSAPPGAVDLVAGEETVRLGSPAPTRDDFDAVIDALSDAAIAGEVTKASADLAITYSGATLSAASSVVVGVVPSSSIIPLREGTFCMLLVASSNHAEPVKLTAATVEGEVGQAAIPREYVGQRFYIDPMGLPERERALCK
nr:peptidoglycan-binding domain-containing protein [Leifsonia soli]